MEFVIAGLVVVVIIQLARLEAILQTVCRNQVLTAKLLGRAHNIPVSEK